MTLCFSKTSLQFRVVRCFVFLFNPVDQDRHGEIEMTPSQSLFSQSFQNTLLFIVAEILDTLLIQGHIYAYTTMFNE